MVQSVTRALSILETLVQAEDDLSIVQLQSRIPLALSTLHRILQTLVASGYVYQTDSTKRYGLGYKLLEVAESAKRHARFRLGAVTHPVLKSLSMETGETTNLALIENDEVVYMDQVPGRHRVRMFTEIGHRAPVFCTGSGKAMLAGLPDPDLATVLNRLTLTPSTQHTLTTIDRLQKELFLIRKRGFAIDNEEFELGVRCVAAAIVSGDGRPVAAISVSGPANRLTRARAMELGPLVSELAATCNQALARDNGNTSGL
jgi:IclR family acetate operon transcriptional repressor